MVRFKAPYNKRPVSDERWPCDDTREGDGVDPRYEVHGPRRATNRKAKQLCSQVATAINLALSESRNDSLRDLYVESVVPAPDSTQLLVTLVRYYHNHSRVTDGEILEAIHGASGWLRSEVANAICRKRVPQLKFVINEMPKL